MKIAASGWKTYALSVVAIGAAILEMLAVDVVPNIDQTTAPSALWAALVAAALRHGIAKI